MAAVRLPRHAHDHVQKLGEVSNQIARALQHRRARRPALRRGGFAGRRFAPRPARLLGFERGFSARGRLGHFGVEDGEEEPFEGVREVRAARGEARQLDGLLESAALRGRGGCGLECGVKGVRRLELRDFDDLKG